MLTEWSLEELVGKKKFIYEVRIFPQLIYTSLNDVLQLFENQSVVEYWENFASHAFENTTQSVHSHCVLLKPSGAPVPATFCFSIRRDLFDLPSIVIGQLDIPRLLLHLYNSLMLLRTMASSIVASLFYSHTRVYKVHLLLFLKALVLCRVVFALPSCTRIVLVVQHKGCTTTRNKLL